MPQVVVARPSLSSSSTEEDRGGFCAARLDTATREQNDIGDVSVVTGAAYIKAVMDHKYDRLQVRDLTVTMVRRRTVAGDDVVDTLREPLLHLPVHRYCCCFHASNRGFLVITLRAS